VAGAARGRQVLAQGHERSQGPRRQRRADRRGRRPEGEGFPEAITATFPDCVVQTCIVHLIRYSMQFAAWKERQTLAKALRPIYTAPQRRGCRNGAGRVRAGPLGPEIGRRRRQLAAPLAGGDPVLRLLRRGQENPLYDKRNRVAAQAGQKGRPQQGPLPQRLGVHQADLPGAQKHHRQVEMTTPGMAGCQSPSWRSSLAVGP